MLVLLLCGRFGELLEFLVRWLVHIFLVDVRMVLWSVGDLGGDSLECCCLRW